MSSIATLINERKTRLNALKENPDVKKALGKLASNPGAVLSKTLRNAIEQLREEEASLAKLEESVENPTASAVEEPARKKAKFASLATFDCDFGASEGKGNKSLIGQRQNLESLYKTAYVNVAVAADAVQAAIDARDGDKLEAATAALDGALGESKKHFEEAARELVIAYSHGWSVVKELRGQTYVRNEQERKALKEAIKAAATKGKQQGTGNASKASQLTSQLPPASCHQPKPGM
ncbi:hypothetical protein GPECTOR_1031g307 [Gonium pectorale]|uniref:Uncharacterized protein n=1 Tax=Gonium pectorale TaxID=33097 RepID=A0A150FTQ7_GONPE|nr:hypothetical protein GPECTOR_1031g307 [Gonium pectorale]|eukprot:KXZ40992.1 hypothetical protein GPECTOR_1031g307 [Gonium pectorale]